MQRCWPQWSHGLGKLCWPELAVRLFHTSSSVATPARSGDELVMRLVGEMTATFRSMFRVFTDRQDSEWGLSVQIAVATRCCALEQWQSHELFMVKVHGVELQKTERKHLPPLWILSPQSVAEALQTLAPQRGLRIYRSLCGSEVLCRGDRASGAQRVCPQIGAFKRKFSPHGKARTW